MDRYLIFHEVTLGSIEAILAAVGRGQAEGVPHVEVLTIDIARTDKLVFDQLEPALRTQMDISPLHLLPVEMEKESCANMLFGRACGDVNEEAEVPGRWAGTSSLPVNSQVSSLFAVRLQVLSHGIDQFREVRSEIDLILGQVGESLGG